MVKNHMGEVRYIFKVVPKSKQRYDTVGDWIPGAPTLIVSSKMNNDDFEFLVLLHEFVEYQLCKKRGIDDAATVAFDKKFEKERRRGLHSASEEPGNSPMAPYRSEHMFATKLEKLVAKQLGINWKMYDKTVSKA